MSTSPPPTDPGASPPSDPAVSEAPALPAPDCSADPVVAAALSPLAGAADLSPQAQLGVYSDAHAALQAALDAEIC